MKYVHVYAFFLMSFFHTSCGQIQTNVSKDNIKTETGNILNASCKGVFRYDGTSFTNLTSEISSPRFSSFWDVLEDRKGNLWFGTKDSGVYCYPSAPLRAGGKSFQHFTTKDGLGSNESDINPYRYLRFPERRFRLLNILFTIYLQRLHFYLQSKSLKPKNIKVDLLHQF
jgi:Two component regulator propeller